MSCGISIRGDVCVLSSVPGGLSLTPWSPVKLTDSNPGPASGLCAMAESGGIQTWTKPVKKLVVTMPLQSSHWAARILFPREHGRWILRTSDVGGKKQY